MFRSLLALFKRRPVSPEPVTFGILFWEEVPECPEAPEDWVVEIGSNMPDWAWNALVRKDIMPVPEPFEGQLDYGGDGLRVVKTDEFFPLGSVMHRSALSS